jgi:hypothetical protein
MLMSIFRNLLLSKRFQDAADFNHQNLNPYLIKNMDAIRKLCDGPEDLRVKSLV